MNILCIGDIVGRPGRDALATCLPQLKKEHKLDFIIVNGENSAAGSGLTSKIAKFYYELGVDVITLGDHVWDQKELEPYLDEEKRLLRPINFPEAVPGHGWIVVESQSGIKIGVINVYLPDGQHLTI